MQNHKTIKKIFFAIVIITMALLFFLYYNLNKTGNKFLIIFNQKANKEIAKFQLNKNETFSISFIHSVNKTPVTDFYKIDDKNNIYVYKTIYYSFGAGVETELENNETIIYNNDGSMTIEHIDKKIDELTYYLSTYSDHILKIGNSENINLRNICGTNQLITFYIK